MIYTGIGSRQTPVAVQTVMRELAMHLAVRGWTLRTGGAEGADQAFHTGAGFSGGDIELYLPWDRYEEGRLMHLITPQTCIWPDPSWEAFQLASQYHPIWERLKQGAQKLHARNCHQVLGPKLDRLTDMIICWTPDGSLDGSGGKTGGTGMALRIAADNGAPFVLNLAIEDHLNFVLSRPILLEY